MTIICIWPNPSSSSLPGREKEGIQKPFKYLPLFYFSVVEQKKWSHCTMTGHRLRLHTHAHRGTTHGHIRKRVPPDHPYTKPCRLIDWFLCVRALKREKRTWVAIFHGPWENKHHIHTVAPASIGSKHTVAAHMGPEGIETKMKWKKRNRPDPMSI